MSKNSNRVTSSFWLGVSDFNEGKTPVFRYWMQDAHRRAYLGGWNKAKYDTSKYRGLIGSRIHKAKKSLGELWKKFSS